MEAHREVRTAVRTAGSEATPRIIRLKRDYCQCSWQFPRYVLPAPRPHPPSPRYLPVFLAVFPLSPVLRSSCRFPPRLVYRRECGCCFGLSAITIALFLALSARFFLRRALRRFSRCPGLSALRLLHLCLQCCLREGCEGLTNPYMVMVSKVQNNSPLPGAVTNQFGCTSLRKANRILGTYSLLFDYYLDSNLFC